MEDPGPTAAYRASFPENADGPVQFDGPDNDDALFEFVDADGETRERENEELYVLLNLPKTASDAEIRDRYRQLAVVYHPDKQRDQARRLAAQNRFTAIQRAYEVLTDPQKRAVYDMFGDEGLRTNWEVGPRLKTPEELRAHFQRQAYEKKQLDAEQLVKSKSDISCIVDARAVFLPERYFKRPEKVDHSLYGRLNRARLNQVMMKHSFETPLTPSTQLVWAGQMVARGGAGGGNVVGTVKHQFSPKLWLEGSTTFLNPRIVTGKATYTVDDDTFMTVNAVQQTYLAPPTLAFTLGRRIYQRTTGFITYKSGFWTLGPWGRGMAQQLGRSDRSGLAVGATTNNANGSAWTLETQVGVRDNHISADWGTKVLGGVKIKFGGSVGTETGISAFVDSERKVTNSVKAGLMVTCALGGGVTMKIKINRLGQKMALPILLSQNLNPYVVLGSTVLPAISFVALHHLYLLPRRKRKIESRIKELREEHAEQIQQKKQEALDAMGLMEDQVARKIAAERAADGLIIVSAHYGLASAFTEKGFRLADGDEVVIDVTTPVQALVQDGHLVIPGGRGKFNLLGFWDPCIGEKKKLRIVYTFRGALHQVTVSDSSPVRAPLRAHAQNGQP